MGSGPEPGLGGPLIRPAVMAAAARCGERPFNDFSAKFLGFRPGYEVFVLGAHPSRRVAAVHLAAVRACIPFANLRFGRYAGE